MTPLFHDCFAMLPKTGICHQRSIERETDEMTADKPVARRDNPLFHVWRMMMARCTNKNSSQWHNYGARGIAVCERWQTFENFCADMAPRPPGKSLERVDNSKGYGPDNCIWATAKQQGSNTRRNLVIELNGISLHLSDWASKLGLHKATISQRLKRGLPPELALSTELTPQRKGRINHPRRGKNRMAV